MPDTLEEFVPPKEKETAKNQTTSSKTSKKKDEAFIVETENVDVDDDFFDDEEEEIVKKNPAKRTFKVKTPAAAETAKKSKSDSTESISAEEADGTPKKKFK